MAEVWTTPATLAHAEALAPHLRPEDAAEVWASGGYTPLEALRASLAVSEVARAVYVGRELLCLYGAAPSDETEAGPRAVVWALTGTAVERHGAAFYRASKRVVPALAAAYPGGLYNYVDTRHARALRWLKRLGFLVLPPQPYGPFLMPFFPVVYPRR